MFDRKGLDFGTYSKDIGRQRGFFIEVFEGSQRGGQMVDWPGDEDIIVFLTLSVNKHTNRTPKPAHVAFFIVQSTFIAFVLENKSFITYLKFEKWSGN